MTVELVYCLYCSKQIVDPWPNQTRHKACKRKHHADKMRDYRAKLKLEKGQLNEQTTT
jgi:hypothetical protein